MAEWSGRGLQNLPHRFDSGSRLHFKPFAKPNKNGHFAGVFVFTVPDA
jgi:hypothetical protein